MTLHLDPAQISELRRKNAGASYGLAIVAGLPFPAEIAGAIADVQASIEQLLPNRFRWYGLHHLHTSIYAPLRSQDRPLRREDLPPDLDAFVCDLAGVLSSWQPFALSFAGVRLAGNGALIISEDSLERQLVSRLSCHPRTAAPKHVRGLTAVIGYLDASQPFTAEHEQESFQQGLAAMRDLPIGAMNVDRVCLVSYGHRTLSGILGKVEFALGRAPAAVTGTDLLASLGVRGP